MAKPKRPYPGASGGTNHPPLTRQITKKGDGEMTITKRARVAGVNAADMGLRRSPRLDPMFRRLIVETRGNTVKLERAWRDGYDATMAEYARFNRA